MKATFVLNVHMFMFVQLKYKTFDWRVHMSVYSNIIISHIKCGAICFCVVSEAASACNFIRQFSPRVFHRFHSNFAWLLVWTIRSAVRKMVNLDLLFKVTEVKLPTFFRVFASFDLKYCMDSIQILHDCSFGSYTVRKKTCITVTYFRGHRGQTLT